MPRVLDWESYAIWQNQGAQTVEQRVVQRLRRILETHCPPPLAEDVQEKIAAILAA